MDVKQIQQLIDADSQRRAKLAEQSKYAGGYNVAILGRRPHEEPDNRVPVPIARKGIRLVSGYMFKPGNIVYSTPEDDGTNYVSNTLKPIFDRNDEELTTQEEAETVLTHGETWEYHWLENSKPRFVEVPAGQCIPMWSDDLPPKLEGMIRHYCEQDGNGQEVSHIYFYDDTIISHYMGKPRSEALVDEMPHGYGQVPFAQFKMARDRSNLFDCVIPLIDFHDRLISEDYANEAQRFASSYLLLRNRLSTDLDESGMNEVDKIRITRTFEDLGDNVQSAVAFLSKNIPVDFIKTAADTFERLIYDMMQIINPNDIATTGQVSGVALAYKLLQFEYLCASIEAYFSRGIQWRIRLIQAAQGITSVSSNAPQVTIQFRRNLPFDMASSVDQFVKVKGLLPDKLALSLFPASFVPDPDAVADEMEEGLTMDSEDSSDSSEEVSPSDAIDSGIVPGADVQAQALIGAQVASLVTVAQAVANRLLPLDTGIEIVLTAFPAMSREDAMRILSPASAFRPEPVING